MQCSHIKAALWAAAVVACTGGAGVLDASPILGVDFQSYDANGPTDVNSAVQSGFAAFNDVKNGNSDANAFTYDNGSQSNAYTTAGVGSGTITVSIDIVSGTSLVTNGVYEDRDRGSAGTTNATYTYSNLYRDFMLVRNQSESSTPVSGMDIVLSGLDKSTQYSIDVYSYDNDGATAYYRDVTSFGVPTVGGSATTPTNAGVTPYASFARTGVPTSNEMYGRTQTFTSDASGNVVINLNSSTGYSEINGLTISAVPEPATLGFGLLAAPLLLSRRRARKA